MSSREFAEWMAFYKMEPFGEERADLRAAIVACTIANVNRAKGKRAFKVDDFMPRFEERRKKTPAELRAKWMMVVESLSH